MKEEQEKLTRDFWRKLLSLYDEFLATGKTDQETIACLEKAGLLEEGTKMGKQLLEAFPHLEFKVVDSLVKQGIREKIVENLKRAPD